MSTQDAILHAEAKAMTEAMAGMIDHGLEAWNMVALYRNDKPKLVAAVMYVGETHEARLEHKAVTADVLGRLYHSLNADAYVGVFDTYVGVKLDDEEYIPPSQDARAYEALAISIWKADAGLKQVHVPYGRNDDGTIDWRTNMGMEADITGVYDRIVDAFHQRPHWTPNPKRLVGDLKALGHQIIRFDI